MRKFSRKLILALILACMLTLSACGDISGTYRLTAFSLEPNTPPISVEELSYFAGADVDTFKAELVLYDDGNAYLDFSEFGFNSESGLDEMTANGTWTSKGHNISLTFDGGEALDATLKGDTITLTTHGMSVVFEK